MSRNKNTDAVSEGTPAVKKPRASRAKREKGAARKPQQRVFLGVNYETYEGPTISIMNLAGDKVLETVRASSLVNCNLSYHNLQAAKLADADLRNAVLRGANLQFSDLNGATLFKADLTVAKLSGAMLCGVDLRGTKTDGADFYNAYFQGALINWNSKEIIAELLRKHASETSHFMFTRMVLTRGWCWSEWTEQVENMPELCRWAINVLREYILLGDNVPALLREA